MNNVKFFLWRRFDQFKHGPELIIIKFSKPMYICKWQTKKFVKFKSIICMAPHLF